MSESLYARSFPALAQATDAEWINGVVTQGHVDYCKAHGHATHKINGITQARCPRCGDDVEIQPTRPLTVDKISDTGKALRAAVAHAADVASAVDEIADELISKETGTVDLDNFHYLRIQDVQNAVDELGKIIRGDWEVCLRPIEAPHVQLLAESIERARQIKAAVLETLASL